MQYINLHVMLDNMPPTSNVNPWFVVRAKIDWLVGALRTYYVASLSLSLRIAHYSLISHTAYFIICGIER